MKSGQLQTETKQDDDSNSHDKNAINAQRNTRWDRKRNRPAEQKLISQQTPCRKNYHVKHRMAPTKNSNSTTDMEEDTLENLIIRIEEVSPGQWIRRIEPYPYTFRSFAKARWVGRSILDVYCSEFGSYPENYYRQAIQQGRITVGADKRSHPHTSRWVTCEYVVQRTDVLHHTVHRHEPAVAVTIPHAPYVTIVGETDDILAVDKPCTMPVHPCGGYHQNSLLPLLKTHRKERFYSIHRLDRLTSGLVLLAKRSEVARDWAKIIQQRDCCSKLYVARVRGNFPTALPRDRIPVLPSSSPDRSLPLYGEWSHDGNNPAYGYWISAHHPRQITGLPQTRTLQEFTAISNSILEWLRKMTATPCDDNDDEDHADKRQSLENFPWLHLVCPVRVVNHKDGICEAGTFSGLDTETYQRTVRSAHTAFAKIAYHEQTDSTVILCRPITGRTHQIRVHLQHMGHPIANDPNYGGNLWYANLKGEDMCRRAQSLLDTWGTSRSLTIPREETGISIISENNNESTSKGLVTTDCPASTDEIERLNHCSVLPNIPSEKRGDAFIQQQSCVWCARLGEQSHRERTHAEFQVRSRGIWLHALQYHVVLGSGEACNFRTAAPSWSCV